MEFLFRSNQEIQGYESVLGKKYEKGCNEETYENFGILISFLKLFVALLQKFISVEIENCFRTSWSWNDYQFDVPSNKFNDLVEFKDHAKSDDQHQCICCNKYEFHQL